MSRSETSLQGFSYGDVVHPFEKRCKVSGRARVLGADRALALLKTKTF